MIEPNQVTCVTLSSVPMIRDNLGNIEYINYVSTFDNEIGLKNATKEALKLVKTPYCFFCDSDDDMPLNLVLPKGNMVYGDFMYFDNGTLKIIESSGWTFKKNLSAYWLIHKPVINTEKAIKIINIIPDLNLHFHFVYYFLLSFIYGSEYNKELKAIWKKNPTGLHTNILRLKSASIRWLSENAENYKKRMHDDDRENRLNNLKVKQNAGTNTV